MKWSISIVFMIFALAVGVGGGYVAGLIKYEPELKEYEARVAELQVSVLKQEQAISRQEVEISSLQSGKTGLETELGVIQGKIADYAEETASLNSQISDLQGRIGSILTIPVIQNYHWSHNSVTWQLETTIPLSLYVEYLNRPRVQSPSNWIEMATDPGDNVYIDQLIQKINDATLNKGYSKNQMLDFVLAFVQSLPYTVDEETTSYNEYPRCPVETLFNRGGDCEDTSILVAAILDRMGYDVALLHLEDARHMAVGVSLSDANGSYYQYEGRKYFYLETTGDGWRLGEIPQDFAGTNAYVYPLRG